jgi:pilus assembly protein CpaC
MLRALGALVLLLLAAAVGSAAAAEVIDIEVGGGRVIALAAPAANVFVADPKVAEVRPASPTSLFVFGVGPGRTTVAAVDAQGHVLDQAQVNVRPSGYAAAEAQTAIARLVPHSRVRVEQQANAMLLTGAVSSAAEAARAVAITRGFAAGKQEVVNDLGMDSPAQVTLQVRIAEMSRTLTRQLGINWQALGTLGSIGKLPALNFALNGGAPVVCAAGALLSVSCKGANLNALVDALATDGLLHMLAEPNLTTMSGEPASFLVGGEFPIPVGQQNGTVTIEFKRFGVQLSFLPTVLDAGRINLRVSPEVSQLSTQGAIQLTAANSSISVPALTVSRAETSVELGSGQSFAIAGLLQNSTTHDVSSIPGLGAIPVLGKLFQSDSFKNNETELVIIVTPVLTRPMSRADALRLPGDAVAAGLPAHPAPADVGFIVQ